MTTYTARPVEPRVLKELRTADDAGRPTAPFTDDEGGAPLRCCLRRSEPGERIALVSYAPLRRWAAETGARPGAYDEQGPVFVHAEECAGPTAGDGPPLRRRAPDRAPLLRRRAHPGRRSWSATVGDDAFRNAFDDPSVALVHVRAVEYGCFLYEVRRPAA